MPALLSPHQKFSKRLLQILAAFLLAAFFLSTNLPAKPASRGLEEVFSNIGSQIKYLRLKNGLRLILLKQGRAPVAAVYMKFLAGSADEDATSLGVAHMLEHMLFKGTRKVGTRNWQAEKKYHWLSVRWMQKLDGFRLLAEEARKKGDAANLKIYESEIRKYRRRLQGLQFLSREFVLPEEDSRLYSQNGGRGYNAYTMADLTNYQIELPANRLEVWARIESDRMQNAVLRDFYPERQVVAEERSMRYSNNPVRGMYETLMEKAYGPRHPYGHSVIGPRRSILYLNYQKAMKFYKTYYAPNNAVIAIVGNFDIAKTEALVRRYFEPIPARYVPPRPKPAAPKRQSWNVEIPKAAPPSLLLAWFKPPMPAKEDLHLSLLSDILASGQESRLFQRLVMQSGLAASVSAFSGYPGERYTNFFIIQVTPKSHTAYNKIIEEIEKELTDIRKKGPTLRELRRIRRKEKASLIYRLRSNSFLADQLSYFELLFSDYKILFDYYKTLDKITAKDLQKAAESYLRPAFRMSLRFVREEKP